MFVRVVEGGKLVTSYLCDMMNCDYDTNVAMLPMMQKLTADFKEGMLTIELSTDEHCPVHNRMKIYYYIIAIMAHISGVMITRNIELGRKSKNSHDDLLHSIELDLYIPWVKLVGMTDRENMQLALDSKLQDKRLNRYYISEEDHGIFKSLEFMITDTCKHIDTNQPLKKNLMDNYLNIVAANLLRDVFKK